MKSSAFFRREPLLRYPEPLYPQGGCEISSVSTGRFFDAVKRPLLSMIMTGLLPIGVLSCDINSSAPPEAGIPNIGSFLKEAEVRELLIEKFKARGLAITEDVPFMARNLQFNADGYDEVKAVGFEFNSLADLWGDFEHPEDFLSDQEISLMDEWNSGDGPFFLVIDGMQSRYFTLEEREQLLSMLQTEIDDYLDYLVDKGVI